VNLEKSNFQTIKKPAKRIIAHFLLCVFRVLKPSTTATQVDPTNLSLTDLTAHSNRPTTTDTSETIHRLLTGAVN
jgi:hypothetical protein